MFCRAAFAANGAIQAVQEKPRHVSVLSLTHAIVRDMA
jgi:hypothetical protein